MKKVKFTKGRWVLASDEVRVLTDENGPDYEIADCTGSASGHPAPIEEQKANAAVIALIPDLLYALKEAQKLALSYSGVVQRSKFLEITPILALIEDVILRAEGEL